MNWFRTAVQDCDGDTEKMLTLVRQRRNVLSLFELDLRDRWGYKLSPLELAEIADFVVQNADQAGVQADEAALAISLCDAMLLGLAPMFCPAPDVPPDDPDALPIVRVILKERQ